MSFVIPVSAPPQTGLEQDPVMPDFEHAHFYFHHTIDSSLEILWQLGISSARISIRMVGFDGPLGKIVGQDPAAGTPLAPNVTVALLVSGLGTFHQLPVGMWDAGGDGEMGTKEIVELFDDSVQKAAHWVREGARIFDIHPDNRPACGRWINLFGLEASQWPEENWYELALLLPQLHQIAGRQDGIRLALKQLLNLDLLEIRKRQRTLMVAPRDLSLLGMQASVLGADFCLGNRLESVRAWEIRIGPLSLARYDEMQEEANRQRLDAVLRLSIPFHQSYEVSYLVLDPRRAPELGIRERNSCLGVNTHLGALQDLPAVTC
ncbi:MAG: type VI secretion system baseplate subunit TssG [Bryobacteraceae bacterium]